MADASPLGDNDSKRMAVISSLDEITEDGILCSIISLLPLKEAVRTCVLSHRWKHIWTHLSCLAFNPYNILTDLDSEIPFVEELDANLRDKFITSVNSVLQHHKGIGVEIFSVKYNLNKTHSHHLDSWVRFAVESKTKRLHLYLDQLYFLRHNFNNTRPEPYNFPTKLLGESKMDSLALMSCAIKLPHGFNGLSHLKNLHLYGVVISEADITQIMSSCLALEVVELNKCQQLATLSISDSLSELENLMVDDCDHLRKIKIDATNLTKLSYSGSLVEFRFRESSQVREVYTDFYTDNMGIALAVISNHFKCLELLWFVIRGNNPQVAADLAENSYRFNHLRVLVWTISNLLAKKTGRLYLSSLMSAAPLLQNLTLQYYDIYAFLKEVKQIKRVQHSPHTHLKTVEFNGFMEDKWQIKFTVHILDFAVNLESITLRKANKYWDRESCKEIYEKNIEYLRLAVVGNARLVIL